MQGLGIPEGDRFIMISEHGEDELFPDPAFLGIPANRFSSQQKRALANAGRESVFDCGSVDEPSVLTASSCPQAPHLRRPT
ncbi:MULTISPECIES: hypothetical protein [Streptomyces]|uniref:hypothetical protein n=1 Tax=Streptomyces TaxID=1883 RepID=UPI0029AAB3AC|nr:hypothetical protein [Streptomyces sp. WI03-4A]MDX2591040.1 hypothetical protein [Streptomyces sp. WI03-4A]